MVIAPAEELAALETALVETTLVNMSLLLKRVVVMVTYCYFL
jgi:hypothetical protein